MHKSVLITLAALLGGASSLPAAYFADQVISYTAGTGASSYTNPATALGAPAGFAGGSAVSPFDPPYETSQMVAVGVGGELTLRLSNFVAVNTGSLGIGVFSNVGLIDTDYPNGVADSSAGVFSAPDSAVVEVSADNVNWYSLNSGAPITFGMPTNYFTNAGPFDTSAPASPQYSDFGLPYAGSRADFANETYAQILAKLNGSAGGTWLSLDGLPVGLMQVDYVRFSGVPAGQTLHIDAVSTNTAITLSPAPEPGSAGLLSMGALLALGVLRLRRRPALSPILAAAAVAVAAVGGAQAQETPVHSFSDITNWVGTGANSAALVIDWADGLNFPGQTVGQSLIWGFHWDGTATGQQMFEAIAAADPNILLNPTSSPSAPTVFGVGYDLDGGGLTYVPAPLEAPETGHALDPNDHYKEGFETAGYWEYWNESTASPAIPTNWISSLKGFATRKLVDGSWDGWAWEESSVFQNPDFIGNPPIAPVNALSLVPEPSAAALLVCGAVLAAARHRG